MKKEILIIEDDPRFRYAITLEFQGTDYEVVEAESVNEGLSKLDEHPNIQVILLDLELPGGRGTEFLEKIKDRISDYRVIVLTAHGELLDVEKAKSFEVFSYVAKPGTPPLESLQFHVAFAFKDLEKAWLQKKARLHLEIDRRIRHLSAGKKGNHDSEPVAGLDQELKDVLALICDHAIELIGAFTCHIRLFDPGRGDFVLWASRSGPQDTGTIFTERKHFNEDYSGIVADSGQPLTIDDLQNDPPFKRMKAAALENGGPDQARKDYFDQVRSARIVPISTGVYGDAIDAVFNINSEKMAYFNEARIELVEDFVTQAAIAATKHLLKEKRAEIHTDYRNISEMLFEVSAELKGEDDLNNIYETVCEKISIGLKPEIISIFRIDDEGKKLKNVAELRARQWFGPVEGDEYLPEDAVVGHIYSSREIIRRNSTDTLVASLPEDDPLLPKFQKENIENIPSGRMQHYLGVPIMVGGERIGVIRAVNKRSELYDAEVKQNNSVCLLKIGFSDDCQTELEIAASHLAVAIQNAELIGKLNKKVNQLAALHTVGERITSEVEKDSLLNLIVNEAAREMRAQICMLFLKDEKGDRVNLNQTFGMDPIPGAHYMLGNGNTGRVAETGKEILEERANKKHHGKYDDQILAVLRQRYEEAEDKTNLSREIETFMAVPIVGKGRILGVIKVINKLEPPYRFDKDDLMLFQVFASQIGLERFLQTQKFLKHLVDESPEPIIFLNEEGKIKIFNKACEELWGYSNDEAVGEPVTKFYVSEDHARDIGRQIWESPDHQVRNIKATIRDKDGNHLPVSLSAAFWLDDEGKRIASFGVFRDLRDMEELQDRMLRSEKLAAIGNLAHLIGHDIKTKISAARNYFEVLEDACERESQGKVVPNFSKKEQPLYFKKANSVLWEAIARVNNLLQAVQPKEPEINRVALKDVFADVSAMSRQAKEIDFIPNVDLTNEVEVDMEQIKSVLWILFGNSKEAIEVRRQTESVVKGEIKLTAQLQNDRLKITWQDNGCGIGKLDLPRIFEPFYTKNKKTGTGLGLYIVKGIVEGHGGDIEVTSVVGQGTSFYLTIPASLR